MRLRKLGAALFAAAALFAVLASSALAAGAVTQDVKWYTGSGSGVALTTPEWIGVTQLKGATFSTEVGGVEYELDWTSTKCAGCTFENVGGTAVGLGKLEFNGITVSKPAGCTVASSNLTRALPLQADWMIGTANYWKFVGGVGIVTEFNFTGCAQARNLVVEGTVFFQTSEPTGVQAVEQFAVASEAVNAAASGGSGALHVGTRPAALSLVLEFKMTGAHAGEPFGTH